MIHLIEPPSHTREKYNSFKKMKISSNFIFPLQMVH